jgi:hypothetical protein
VCSICLASLKEKLVVSTEHAAMSESMEMRGEEPISRIVKTPCKHKFHIECLIDSMKNKLLCPNCRSPLP